MNPLYKADALKVLEQVRPYIKADGGDVELVDIADNGIVTVRLTGNCVGCASAGVTLFDGIQAALQGQLAWVTGVEKLEDGEAVPSAEADVTAAIRAWQERAFEHVRAVLDALEDLKPGDPLPDAVPAFIDASRGMIASLLRLEEDVLYGAAESVLGMTSGPAHLLRQEHDLLRKLFADFTQTVIRYGGEGGPGRAALWPAQYGKVPMNFPDGDVHNCILNTSRRGVPRFALRQHNGMEDRMEGARLADGGVSCGLLSARGRRAV
jgi:Fe-S cluster biogenesis protein NfuA